MPQRTGYGLGVISQTFLGNIEVRATYSPEIKKVFWLFGVGYWF